MKKTIRACVVIPAFNESTVISDVVESMAKELEKTSFDYKIVVVNDGSSDATAEQARLGGATVINHILNSGAGAATATGLSYAAQNLYDIAATMDADGQHHPEDVVKGLNLSAKSEADLIIGSRLIDSSGMSKTKVLGNKGLSLITYILFGIRSTDSQSGLRIFSSHALKELRWTTSGYEFCSEMLWRAKQAGITTNEYPIRAIYTDYSKGKGQNNWNAINIIKSLLARRITELLG